MQNKILSKNYVVIRGGLGNQMSQYAFYLNKVSFSEKRHQFKPLNLCKDYEHNGFELTKIFDICKNDFEYSQLFEVIVRVLSIRDSSILQRLIIKMFTLLGYHKIYEPANYQYIEASPPIGRLNFYIGGWHNERYFKNIEDKIRKIYKFDASKVNDNTKEIAEEILKQTSVSIHIRRGDYLTVGALQFGGICDISYYTKAISYIQGILPNAVFYIFTDEPMLFDNRFSCNGIVVNWNQGQESWQDMYLMSLCKHNIVANSTFSWWGAWLNGNSNKIIICPKHFAKNSPHHIYPENWICL